MKKYSKNKNYCIENRDYSDNREKIKKLQREPL